VYLDSCILVKLVIREADSRWFDQNLRGHALETSDLALAEVRSALLAKERAGCISSRERISAGERFTDLIEDETFRLLPLNRRVLERAIAMQLACHPRVPLRTLDALHLATCDLHNGDSLATTDARLRDACEQFAIALFPARLEQVILDEEPV